MTETRSLETTDLVRARCLEHVAAIAREVIATTDMRRPVSEHLAALIELREALGELDAAR